MRWPGPCHPRLLELLWKVVLGPEDKVSSKTMGLMLSVVKKRMRKVAGRVGGKSSTIRKARVVGSGGDVSRAMETPELLQPEGLAALLRDHIFSSPLDVVDPELQGWIKDTICSTLCLDQGDRTYAFSHLVLMGTVASSSPPTSLSPKFPNINLPMKTNDFSTDFRVLHILAILERIASGKKGRDFGQLYEDNSEKINSVLMSLWESWVSSSLSRPKRVSSTIVASFVYLAGRTNNPSLMKLCGELYLSEDTLSPHSYSVWVEYVLALVGIGSTSEGVLRVLDAIPEYRSRVTTEVLRRIALGDSAFAHDLFLQTKQTGIQVPDDTVLELVAALIRDGHLNLVVSFLERPTSKARRLQTLTMLCQAIPHHPEYISSSEVAGRIASAIMDLSPATIRKQCPRRPLKITLQNIARAEQVSSAIAAHLHITSRHPRWFPPSCYTPLLQYALKQRRFKDAFRLFENANMTYPKISGFWCRLLIQQFSRAGASKLAQKLMKYLKPGEKRNPSIAVARHMGFQELKPSRVGTIRLPSFLSSPRRNQNIDVNDPRHILQLLTRAGRHSAAIKLFGRIRQEYSPGIQTALGNIILNASLRRSPRYGHGRMRQALSTLKLLISKHDFKPDRISVNILIKAILLWKQEVDWYVVRALFDRMVRGGYPMGGIVGLGEVPFGTEDGEMVLGGVVLPKLDSRVDFRRHVRPLYRMFVKALFLRGDEVGARRVVGILKLVETEVRRGRGGEGRG